MENREGPRTGRDQEQTRKAAAKKAERWTATWAVRLDTSADEILAAILRGWLPEDIECCTSKYSLEGTPLCSEIREGIEKIKVAPVEPVLNTRPIGVSSRNPCR